MNILLKQNILSFLLIRLNCRVHILCVTEVKWYMQMNWRLSYLTSALLPCPEYWIFNTLVTVIAIYSKTIRDLCWRRCAHKDYTSLEDGTHNSGLWTQHLLLLTSCRTKDAWPTFHLMLLLTQTSKQAQTIFVTFWRISDHLWQPYCYYIASGWLLTSLEHLSRQVSRHTFSFSHIQFQFPLPLREYYYSAHVHRVPLSNLYKIDF